MPPKRQNTGGGSVTGGTGDVKPQLLTFSLTQSAADTATTGEFPTPVPRAAFQQDKAQVMEILKVFFFRVGQAPAEADSSIGAYLSTNTPPATVTFLTAAQQSGTFAECVSRRLITTSGVMQWDDPVVIDLTDDNGNGYLVATDQVIMGVISSASGNANTVVAKILYRMVNISVYEYIGIVQSQQ